MPKNDLQDELLKRESPEKRFTMITCLRVSIWRWGNKQDSHNQFGNRGLTGVSSTDGNLTETLNGARDSAITYLPVVALVVFVLGLLFQLGNFFISGTERCSLCFRTRIRVQP